MPNSIVAGNTPLGQFLNQQSQLVTGSEFSKYNTKYATISEVAEEGTYVFYVHLFGDPPTKKIGPIRIKGHPAAISLSHGEPDDLIGHILQIDFNGVSVRKGQGELLGPLENIKAVTAQANEVQVTGAAFAPPGKGQF
jgi:hypothetical protein